MNPWPAWSPPPSPPPQPWGRPAGPSAVWAVALWGVAVVCLVGALVLGGIASFGFWYDNYLDNHGVTTTATVTEVDGGTITAEFTTEDDYRATAEITWYETLIPAVGDQVEITYDPDGPAYAIEAGSVEDFVIASVLAFAAVVALGAAVGACVGAVLIHRARGKAARRWGPTW